MLLALLATLLAGCGTDAVGSTAPDVRATHTATPSDTPSPSGTTPSTTPAPSSTPAQVIAYAGGESIGYEVRSPEDVEGMQGAPQSFKRFIARTIRGLAADSTCEAPSEVVVQFLSADGFATGAVNDCGGYQALWVELDGGWKEVDGTQEMVGCAVLETYHVPSDLVDGRCYDYETQQQRDYEQN